MWSTATVSVVGVALLGAGACAPNGTGAIPSGTAAAPVAPPTADDPSEPNAESTSDDLSEPDNESAPDERETDTDVFAPVTATAVGLTLVTTLESAVDMAPRPNHPDIYVAEHDGRVVRVSNNESQVVIDVRERYVDHADEQGLNGIEFDATGDIAWLHGTTATGVTEIWQYTVAEDGTFDPGSETLFMRVDSEPGLNHNSGDMLLLPDGSLLITLGDGNGRMPEGDPYRYAQDPTAWRGSILRVVPTPDSDTPYAVPADNPFADGPLERAGTTIDGAPEVLAWGLRNPWKIDYDPPSDSLWIADAGLHDREEINRVDGTDGLPPAWGTNFGWSRLEGDLVRDPDIALTGGPHTPPIHAYEHEGIKCAISGGEVYRGSRIPELYSGYVFADFCEGSVWVLDATTNETRQLLGGIPAISGVRAGPGGELFVLSWHGEVYAVTPAA